MKLAFLIFKYFPFGGVQRDMLRIAIDCAMQGHQITIYTGQWRGDKPAHSNIDIVILPKHGWLNHWRHQSLIRAMHAAIKQDAPDLVVGFNRMQGLDVYYAADPCFKAKAYDTRCWLYRLSGRYRFFAASEDAVMNVHGHCRILMLSPGEKRLFQQWYGTPEQRFYDVPPNIPLARFVGLDKEEAISAVRQEFQLPMGAFLILFVGSAFLRKGLDRVIRGVAALPEPFKSKTYVLAVGEDKPQAMKSLAEMQGIGSQLIICEKGRSDVPVLMLAADILVHPARSELAGLVIIEALTAGLPVLITDNCGYATYAAEAGAGFVLSTPFVQEELNDALLEMQDQGSLQRFGAAGRAYAVDLANRNSASYEADLIVRFAREKYLALNRGSNGT